MDNAKKEGEFKSTKTVLEQIGLQSDEVNTYFKMTGRGPVVVGEMALLTGVAEERAVQIAKNLLEKGLIREIPGKTPHYMALPPYAALLSQLSRFKEVVKDIQKAAPRTFGGQFLSVDSGATELQLLEDYIGFIREMKMNVPAQIKNQFERFEAELALIKKISKVKSFINSLRENAPEEISKEFTKMQSQLENIKAEISKAFEKQFRIGALKTFAEKIVARIVSKEFQAMSNYFQTRFVQTTRETLDQVIGQLGGITDTAGEIGSGLDTAFETIDSGLRLALDDLEVRIRGVHKEIKATIDELRSLFTQEIYEKLQKEVLFNIVNQLEMSEATMREFWERSKKASLLTFKDVWFIRSAEGMMAQINDAISRVKMRLYIVAPKLEHVDVVALSKVRHHVNIRISTNFDEKNPTDRTKIEEIKKYPNMQLRYFTRQDLWAINKDFEELVVCVVSSSPTSGEMEIAGIGSILEEHIKLFAGVLEEVWIASRKI